MFVQKKSEQEKYKKHKNKKDPTQTFRDENYNIWEEKYIGWN